MQLIACGARRPVEVLPLNITGPCLSVGGKRFAVWEYVFRSNHDEKPRVDAVRALIGCYSSPLLIIAHLSQRSALKRVSVCTRLKQTNLLSCLKNIKNNKILFSVERNSRETDILSCECVLCLKQRS